MFQGLLALGIRSGTIFRVSLDEGRVETAYDRAGRYPDGVVVEDGNVFWTTMGRPERHLALKARPARSLGAQRWPARGWARRFRRAQRMRGLPREPRPG